MIGQCLLQCIAQSTQRGEGGSLLGTVIGVPLEYTTKRFRRYEWPFGAYLGVAALFSSFAGKAVIDWYLRVSGLD